MQAFEVKEMQNLPPTHLNIPSKITNLQTVCSPVQADLLSFRICVRGTRINHVLLSPWLLINDHSVKRAYASAFWNFRLWCSPGFCNWMFFMWLLLKLVPHLNWCTFCEHRWALYECVFWYLTCCLEARGAGTADILHVGLCCLQGLGFWGELHHSLYGLLALDMVGESQWGELLPSSEGLTCTGFVSFFPASECVFCPVSIQTHTYY